MMNRPPNKTTITVKNQSSGRRIIHCRTARFDSEGRPLEVSDFDVSHILTARESWEYTPEGSIRYTRTDGSRKVMEEWKKGGWRRPESAMEVKPTLFQAAGRGKIDDINEALDQGADVDIQDEFGRTSIAYAAWGGLVPVVQVLLARGADPNIPDDLGHVPLLYAMETHCEPEVVRLLLDAGADVNPPTGQRPLMRAITETTSEIVGLLLDAGARVSSACENDTSPLALAKFVGDPVVIRMIEAVLKAEQA